jgi:hypothetical protein
LADEAVLTAPSLAGAEIFAGGPFDFAAVLEAPLVFISAALAARPFPVLVIFFDCTGFATMIPYIFISS